MSSTIIRTLPFKWCYITQNWWEFTNSKPVINRVIRLWTDTIICMHYTTRRCKKVKNTSCLENLSTSFQDLVWRKKDLLEIHFQSAWMAFFLLFHKWITIGISLSLIPALYTASKFFFYFIEFFAMMYRRPTP